MNDANNGAAQPTAQDPQTVTFHEMRSTIEEKIDDVIFKTFKIRNYDSKEA